MQRPAVLITTALLLLFAVRATAQQSRSGQTGGTAASDHATTVRGCLQGSRGNYVLIEDQSNLAYVLKGVGNKLDHQLHHEVEVKGTVLPGTIKTGIRPEKSGSNPSDTVHGVDGLPLHVANLNTDIHTISNKCKAADEQ